MHSVCVCCGRTFQLDIISFTHGVVTAHVHITCSWNILPTCKGHTRWYSPRLIEGPSFVSDVLFCLSRNPFLLPLFLFVCLHSCCLFVVGFLSQE